MAVNILILGDEEQNLILTAEIDYEYLYLATAVFTWFRDGLVIDGETTDSLVLTEADVGSRISVHAEYINSDGDLAYADSTETGLIANVNDAPTGDILFGTENTQGQDLSIALNSISDPDGVGLLTYHWFSGGNEVQTGGLSLHLTNDMVGSVITLTATYTDGHGTDETVTGGDSVTVLDSDDQPDGAVVLTGNHGVGSVVTADTSMLVDIDGLGTLHYDWYAGGSLVGDDQNTLLLDPAMAGQEISVTVYYTDGHGNDDSIVGSGWGMVDDLATVASVIAGEDSATEGTTLDFAVTLTAMTTSEQTFSFSLGGSASDASDMAGFSFDSGVEFNDGFITVPANVGAFHISVITNNDTLDENAETLSITVDGVIATSTVLDDDTATIASIDNALATEGSALDFHVALTGAADHERVFEIAIDPGSTSSGDHGAFPPFYAFSTDNPAVTVTNDLYFNGMTIGYLPHVHIPAGVSDFNISVSTTDDDIDELTESFTITISDAFAIGTIEDNDTASIAAFSDATATEGGDLVFNISVLHAADHETHFPISIGDVTTTAADYDQMTFTNGVTFSDGEIYVPANVSSFQVHVPTVDDAAGESTEQLTLHIGSAQATGSIEDNDGLTVSSGSANEGEDAVFTVSLAAAAGPRVYAFATADVTTNGDFDSNVTANNAGVHFGAGDITIDAGVSAFTLTVHTTDDSIDESDETFALLIGSESATGTIVDNDTATVASISSGQYVTEGEDVVHTITMSTTADHALTYAFSYGSASTSADDFTGLDFSNGVTLAGGLVTVPADTSAFTITVHTADDSIDENTETFSVNIGGHMMTDGVYDNDTATLSVTDASAIEGEDISFLVTLSNTADHTTIFPYSVNDGTALSGEDYAQGSFDNGVSVSNGNLYVPAGVTSFHVTFSTTNDSIDEGDETFTANIGSATATGTIIDNDAPVAPSIAWFSDAAAVEGDDLKFHVHVDNMGGEDTGFAFEGGLGTANLGGDFDLDIVYSNGVTYSNGQLIVPGGVSDFIITIHTFDDAIDESDETVRLVLGGLSATGTISDDDTALVASTSGDQSVVEGGTIVHTVTLSTTADHATEFSFGLLSNTLSADDLSDITFSNGVTFSDGVVTVPSDTNGFNVFIVTHDDNIDESDETFKLFVGGFSDTMTIVDNDTAVLSIQGSTVSEGDTLDFHVTLSHPLDHDLTVPFQLSEITTNGADHFGISLGEDISFNSSDNTITIPAGTTDFHITIATSDDNIAENTEMLEITLGAVSAIGTILDNDTIAIDGVEGDSATEGEDLHFFVTLTGAASFATSYSLVLSDDYATSPEDYDATNLVFSGGVTFSDGMVTVPAGVSAFEITVHTVQDSIDENDDNFLLLVDGYFSQGVILDDDTAAVTGITSPVVNEGEDLTFTVTFSNEANHDATYNFAVFGDSITSDDFSLADITFSNGVTVSDSTITVPAGITEFTITLPTVNDTVDEYTESLEIVIGGQTGTGTVFDDDTASVLFTYSDSAMEGDSLAFNVSMSAAADHTVRYAFSLTDITASAGDHGTPTADHGVTFSDGDVVVPAGVTFFTISVPTTQDATSEASETISISVGGHTTTGKIIDDDAVTVVGFSDDSATEGAQLSFGVQLSGVTQATSVYAFSLANVTTASTDHGAITFSNGVTYAGGMVTVPIGVSAFTISVASVNDTIDESNEAFTLTLDGQTATGTIVDDDTQAVTSVSSPSAKEGTSLVFSVALNGAADASRSYAFSLADTTTTSADYNLASITFSNGVFYSDGEVIVPAGVSGFSVTLPTIDDHTPEDDEFLQLTIGNSFGTATIKDALIVIRAVNGKATGTTADEYLIGSDARDTLTGGGGNDWLWGKGLLDKLVGGTGNDTYIIKDGQDTIVENNNEGNDTVQTWTNFSIEKIKNVENITLMENATQATGNTLDNMLIANTHGAQLKGLAGNDTLVGGIGNDVLNGGAGKDVLIGGEGHDRFVFDVAPTASTVDVIQGFDAAEDEIALLRKVFSANKTVSSASWFADAFWVGTAAHDSNDRIIFNNATGALYYDQDGTGSKPMVQIALITDLEGTLTADNFFLI